MFQHFVLVGVVFSLIIAPLALRRVPRRPSLSLSQHIAKDDKAIHFAQALFPVVAGLVVAWYFGWYASTHFTFLLQGLLLVAVCLLAALSGLVPYLEGKRAGTLHNVFAWTYAYMLPILVMSFFFTSESQLTKVIIGLCGVWQLYGVVLYWFHTPARRYFLYYQLSYIGAFAVALLATTYIG
ncbi:hypothetical protein KA093_02505 [Candidatus Saccharibacteria bacterium]|nr:hypothetical protein [Candidatus Saccharibacteria bacterium]